MHIIFSPRLLVENNHLSDTGTGIIVLYSPDLVLRGNHVAHALTGGGGGIGFLIDPLTATMMLVVTFVSLMVHIYTIGYMQEDLGYNRFFSYISLFTFSMLMLVMSNNFMQLFFGWEARCSITLSTVCESSSSTFGRRVRSTRSRCFAASSSSG